MLFQFSVLLWFSVWFSVSYSHNELWRMYHIMAIKYHNFLWMCKIGVERCMVWFLRMGIFIQMMDHHSWNLAFKFHLNRSHRLDKRRDEVFCNCIPDSVNLILVTTASHILINIFQTIHFSAVKFNRGNDKNISFLLIPISQKVWKKKSETIGPGSFNFVIFLFS